MSKLKQALPLTEQELNAIVNKAYQISDGKIVSTVCRFRNNRAHVLKIRTLPGQWAPNKDSLVSRTFRSILKECKQNIKD